MTTTAPPIHECVDCQARPEAERPRAPRPAPHGGPRSRRCSTDQRAYDRAKSRRGSETRRQRVYGIAPDEQRDLWTYQGRRCPCGRCPALRTPETDHDHACCPGSTSCGGCVRGMLEYQCNREIIGRLEHVHRDHPEGATAGAILALRSLLAYLERPPLARMRLGEPSPWLAAEQGGTGEFASLDIAARKAARTHTERTTP